MKYYFVSDLHGCNPQWLKTYLEDASFNSETDTLVIVGDVVDRGLYSIPLIKYIDSFPHVIRLCGNHDYRTKEIVCRTGSHPNMYDKHNGVAATLHSICDLDPASKLHNIWYYLNVLMIDSPAAKQNINIFLNYCSRCVWALEFNNLIVTHGWLPHKSYPNREGKLCFSLLPLEDGSVNEWVDATWAATPNYLAANLLPKKNILVGHWWAGDLRARFEQHKLFDDAIRDGTVDFSTFKYKNATFIDPCIGVSNTINVVTYEADDEPYVYVTAANGKVVKKPLSEAQL